MHVEWKGEWNIGFSIKFEVFLVYKCNIYF